MTAYDLAYIAGAVVGGVVAFFAVRKYVRKPPAESVDPRCEYVDTAGHRCVRMTGHRDDHQILSVYARPNDRG